MSNRIDSK